MENYEERFVAFVDILGFTDLIDRSIGENHSISPAQIMEALQTPEPIRRDKVILGRIGDISESGHRMVSFSDCVVITADPTEQGLLHILHHVEKIGFRLLKLGYLCRGGITKGLIYHHNEVVFGPAMIKAYLLEKNQAKMPRIILDDEVTNVGISSEPPVNTIFSRFTRKDTDNFYFVNILRSVRMVMDTESGPPEDFQQICNNIEKHLLSEIKRLVNHERELKKVEWFKRYFDWAQNRSSWELLNQPLYP